MIMGIINGGLGFKLAGYPWDPKRLKIPYAVFGGLMFLFYVCVVLFAFFQGRKPTEATSEREKYRSEGGVVNNDG